jgi:hypothetical protein
MILTVIDACRDGNGFIIVDLVDDDDQDPKNHRHWKKVATIEDQYGTNKLELKGWVANAVINQGVMLADYAYGITCHKSQGSEWNKLLVLEEVHRDWTYKRWVYTAITRAAQEVAYCYQYIPRNNVPSSGEDSLPI